jgi:purine nucleosidase
MTEKILLDTDIGSDIDDAVCLAYLLARPDCDLLGITTVHGRTDERAMLASVLCKVAGKKIPIFPGSGDSLLGPHDDHAPPQASALPKWDHDKSFPKGEAIEFLRSTIRRHPGEVTLLAIGPMTNLALLFKSDPEIPSLLKRLVLMCGVFSQSLKGAASREYNAHMDAHATAIVYAARPPLHRSIGLDVTNKVTAKADEVRRRFTHPLLRPVLDFAEVWFQKVEKITFHDPLAAVTIFDPEVCCYEKGLVEIELESARMKGLTYWKPNIAGSPHEVALGVDVDRFFKDYFGVFK